MTTIANCLNIAEAMRIQIVLHAAEISTFIPDEHMAAMAPHLFLVGSGVRVQVADEDADEARRVITEAKESERQEQEQE
jgi:hypothetical protein